MRKKNCFKIGLTFKFTFIVFYHTNIFRLMSDYNYEWSMEGCVDWNRSKWIDDDDDDDDCTQAVPIELSSS